MGNEIITTHPSDCRAPRPDSLTLRQSLRRSNQGGKLTTLLIFLPPALLLFTVFIILPLGEAGYYSLFKWNGYSETMQYVGGRNYARLVHHSVFHTALLNSLMIIVVSLCIQLPLALSLALLIYKKHWGNTLFRLLFFVPFILAEVATGLIWRFVFDGEYGITAMALELFGQESFYVLAEKGWAFGAVLLVIVWKYFGYHMMIYIAGLQAIPDELVEAARLDGATPWQIAWHIKIPLLWPAIRVSIFFCVLGSLQAFDILIPMVPDGGPAHSANTLATYLYNFGIVRMKVGYGSCVGILLFCISLVFAFTYQSTIMRQKNR